MDISYHVVTSWQKRFGDYEMARSKIRESYQRGFNVEVIGKRKSARFDPSRGSIFATSGDTIKTVMFVENQRIKYKDDVWCRGCGRRVNVSTICSDCGSEYHVYNGSEFSVDW